MSDFAASVTYTVMSGIDVFLINDLVQLNNNSPHLPSICKTYSYCCLTMEGIRDYSILVCT